MKPLRVRGLRFSRPPRGPFKAASLNRLLPNIMTMIGLCVGLTAVRFAFEGRWENAAVCIVVAGAIDGVDGRLARLLKATSRFGEQFDSLSDFLCFGVAPGLILYFWTLQGARGYGFIPCLLFAVCMALRLARFNAALATTADAPPRPAYAAGFFTGVPAPAGAGLALFPLFASLAFEGWGMPATANVLRHPLLAAVILVGVAALLVSTLPTFSFKNPRIPRDAILPLLLGAAAYVALLVTEPWAALAAAGLIYGGMIPLSLRAHARQRAATPT